MRKLMPHQVDAFKYTLRERHPALFMEMRTGKTLVAIRRILGYTPRIAERGLRVLIIAPYSALGSWEDELLKEDQQDYVYLTGSREERLAALREGHRWNLINKEGWFTLPEIGEAARCPRCDGHKHIILTRDTDSFWTEDGERWDVLSVDGWHPTLLTEDGELLEPYIPTIQCTNCRGRGWVKAPGPMWDVVVADESTFLKNARTKTTKWFLRSFSTANHRWIFSGLPNPESDLDLICQMVFLRGSWMGCRNYWSFRQCYYYLNRWTGDWAAKRGTEQRMRSAVQKDAFVCSRKDAQMPDNVVRERRLIEPSEDIKRALYTVRHEFTLQLGTTQLDQTLYSGRAWTWMRQLAGGFAEGELIWDGKLTELRHLLTGELAREPVVVWFAFNIEIDAAEEVLSGAGLRVEKIYGSVRPAERRAIVRRFQAGETRVLLLQQMVAQFGMDLSASDTAIYYSRHYSLQVNVQSADRIVHPSKRHPIMYVDLLAKGSIDETIYDVLIAKRWRSQRLMDAALSTAIKERFGNEQTNVRRSVPENRGQSNGVRAARAVRGPRSARDGARKVSATRNDARGYGTSRPRRPSTIKAKRK